jgi:hypothetical protein
MLAIAKKLGFADLKSFQASLKTNPKLRPRRASRCWMHIGATSPDAGQAAGALWHAAEGAVRSGAGAGFS